MSGEPERRPIVPRVTRRHARDLERDHHRGEQGDGGQGREASEVRPKRLRQPSRGRADPQNLVDVARGSDDGRHRQGVRQLETRGRGSRRAGVRLGIVNRPRGGRSRRRFIPGVGGDGLRDMRPRGYRARPGVLDAPGAITRGGRGRRERRRLRGHTRGRGRRGGQGACGGPVGRVQTTGARPRETRAPGQRARLLLAGREWDGNPEPLARTELTRTGLV
mmetsp:Transcript_10127/g.46363  ORF Transcript_10127/g.46363 Transcript_10127/m.46363 type:complete len:220 (-) Transcript_10127:1734-2393(-)